MKQVVTKCSKCKRTVKVRTVDVFDKNSASQQVLYVAQCSHCRHTIYANDLEEMMR